MTERSKIAAILLAAGQSSRFGSEDKLLANMAGEAVVMHAAYAIRPLAPATCIAVCADSTAPVAHMLAGTGFRIVENRHPELGMSRSLAIGIAAAALTSCDAALVCLGDMPFVSTAHLQALLDRFDPEYAPIVASSQGDAAMPPALFHRANFARLQSGTGDSGGRSLLADAVLVRAPAGELRDIDVPRDLA